MTPRTTKDAAWREHLETLPDEVARLRAKLAEARTEASKQRQRAERWEQLYRKAAKQRESLRDSLYKAQVRRLVSR